VANDVIIKVATEGIKKAKGDLDEIGGAAQGLSGKMSSVGRGMTLGVTAPIVAGATLAVQALGRIETIGAQTDAAIKSTGGVANVTRQDIDGMADSLEKLTSIEAETITEGQNMLLTFTKVRNEVGKGNDIFDQGTKAALDMSVALGTDMSSASMLVGKALNDPIKGLTALSRSGIQFTKEQKEMITGMVEAGDTMGAQKIILGELTTQFGGSAEALGDTMTGKIDKMKNAFGEVSETLASALLPVLQSLTAWLQKVADWFNNLSPAAQKTIGVLIAVAAAVGPVLIVGAKLVSAFGTIMKAFKALQLLMMANPWVLLIAAVVALVILIVANWDKILAFLKKAWDWIKGAAAAVGNFIKDAFKKAVDFLVGLFLNFTPLGLIIKHFDKIKAVATGVKDWIVNAFTAVIDFFKELPGKITNAVGNWLDGLKTGFKNAINWIIGKWNDFKIQIQLPSILGGGKISIETPNIPKFHSGTNFFTPPGGADEGLAILQRGEKVTPRGGSEMMHVTLMLDGRVLLEEVRHLDRKWAPA
jgi:hypothetical protein